MQKDLSSGEVQANLKLSYAHHKGKTCSLKDFQVASAEFIGTFFVVFSVATSKNTDPSTASLAIGFCYCAMVYMTAPISGGMINPAVTIGLMVRNKMRIYEGAYCIFSQLTAGLMAGLLSFGLYGNQWDEVGAPIVNGDTPKGAAFVAEMLQTFLLASVVLNSSTTKAQENNNYYGIAIGFVVLVGSLCLSGVTGASFNPAVSILTLLHGHYGDMIPVFLGPIVGGIIAGLVFRITNPSEWDDTDPLAKLTNAHHNPHGNITRLIAMLTQEAIGTFFLVYVVALSVNSSLGFMAVGLIIPSLAYSGGSISGGHYNPIVTFAVYCRGLTETPPYMRTVDLLLYTIIQILAALCAVGVGAFVNNGYDNITQIALHKDSHTLLQAFVAEFIYTFGFILTVLNVATSPKCAGNSYYGLAIGFIIMAGAIAVGDISGSAFNPSIAISFTVLTSAENSNVWVYLLSEYSGCLCAVGMFKFWYIGYISEESDYSQDIIYVSDKKANNSSAQKIMSAFHILHVQESDSNTNSVNLPLILKDEG